eukprot:2208288-Rhodomonas_salina.1
MDERARLTHRHFRLLNQEVASLRREEGALMRALRISDCEVSKSVCVSLPTRQSLSTALYHHAKALLSSIPSVVYTSRTDSETLLAHSIDHKGMSGLFSRRMRLKYFCACDRTCGGPRVPMIMEIISATPGPSPTETSPFLPTAVPLMVRNLSRPCRKSACSSELHGVIVLRSFSSLLSEPLLRVGESLGA